MIEMYVKTWLVKWALRHIQWLYARHVSYATLGRYGIEDLSVADGEFAIIVRAVDPSKEPV